MTTRVMLVDDAVVVRHILSDTLSKAEGIEVVGTAADGEAALQKLPALRPDVVVLDVEMPKMDGIETLAVIKRLYPGIKVIMFSTLTSRGAAATMDALMQGADDYVTKPANVGSIAAAIDRINSELTPKIRALHTQRAVPGRPAAAPSAPSPATAWSARPVAPPSPRTAPGQRQAAPPSPSPGVAGEPPAAPRGPAAAGTRPATAPAPLLGSTAAGRPTAPAATPKILTIAVSTGGPNALAALLPELPADLAVPIVVVQHIPPIFSKALADRLDTKCALKVAECVNGTAIAPGEVWIAPGDFHMVLRKDGTQVRLETNQGPPENSCRPAADVLFRSVVAAYGPATLGLVLTGMGNDGLKGSQAIVQAGGRVVVQDEATSVVWGMPGAVCNAGIADAVLPIDRLAAEIVARVGTRRTVPTR